MDYPGEELFAHKDELIDALREEAELFCGESASLIEFIQELSSEALIDAQENYVSLFDRGRRLSLLLFEHVHGESRDRGQAMVDLMNAYHEQGFFIDAKELPDYLPLFLEFLSHLDLPAAKNALLDVSHILALLAVRLMEKPSPYHKLFTALLALADAQEDLAEIRQKIRNEKPDDTAEAMDKIWEEEAVSFMGNLNPNSGGTQGCGTTAVPKEQSSVREAPVQWIDPREGNRKILHG